MVIGTSSQVPWNGRGWRLVELPDGRYSEGDSQGLPYLINPHILGIPIISFQLKFYSLRKCIVNCFSYQQGRPEN